VVKVSCPDEDNVYRVEKGAMVHTGPSTPLEVVSAEFVGLNSIRVPKVAATKDASKEDEAGPNQTAMSGTMPYRAEFTVEEPVRVFVGFALQEWTRWYRLPADWKVPEGWTLYAQKAVTILDQGCDVYYRDFPAGTSTIAFKHGPIVVVGFTRPDAPLVPVAKRYYGWQMFTCPMP
jgi:hypothetical protein